MQLMSAGLQCLRLQKKDLCEEETLLGMESGQAQVVLPSLHSAALGILAGEDCTLDLATCTSHPHTVGLPGRRFPGAVQWEIQLLVASLPAA
jgi:hypothetical protein